MGIKLIFAILFVLFANNSSHENAGTWNVFQKHLTCEPIVKSGKQAHDEDSWKDIVENAYPEVAQQLATYRLCCNFYFIKMYRDEHSKSIEPLDPKVAIRLMEISDTRIGYLMWLFHKYSMDVDQIFVDYWLFTDLEYLWELYAGSSKQNEDKIYELFSKALGNKFLPSHVPPMTDDDALNNVQQAKDGLNKILDRMQMYLGETRWFTMDNFSLRPLMQSDQLMELRKTIFPKLDVPLDRCYDEIVRKTFNVNTLLQYHSFALHRLDAIVTEEFAYLVAAYGQLLLSEERLHHPNKVFTEHALNHSANTIISYVYIMERLFVGQIQFLWSSTKLQAYQFSCKSKFQYDPAELKDTTATTIAIKCKKFGFNLSGTDVSINEWWKSDVEERITGTKDSTKTTEIDKYMNLIYFISESTERIFDKLVAICDAFKFPYNVTSFTVKDRNSKNDYYGITLT